jgi:DNA-binding transcriptional ArsR family regulator
MVKHSGAALAAAGLDAAFAALADPTRRSIVARLASSERSVGELAKPLPMSLPAVSKHLRILEGAGLVARRKVGRTHVLRLVPAALEPAQDWIARHRAFWTSRLDALGRYLAEEASTTAPPTKGRRPRRR